MLSHVTATIAPVRYSVIIYLFCAYIYLKCFKLFKKGTHYETKRNSDWDSSRSFCMLKGFDKALRVSLPHIWVETSGFGNENHVVESDRASVFDLIGVLV